MGESEGGGEVEAGWDWAPEGQMGEGKGSHTRRGRLGDHWEGRGSKGSGVRFPLPTWAPGPDPLPTEVPSSHAGPEGVGGREGGAKVKATPTGQHP